jgi:hypothetical protein
MGPIKLIQAALLVIPASAQLYYDDAWLLNLIARQGQATSGDGVTVPPSTTLLFQESQVWTSGMTVPADVKGGLRLEWGGAFPANGWKPDHIAYGVVAAVVVPAASTALKGVAAVSGQIVGGSAATGLNGGLFTAAAGSNAGYIFGGNSQASSCGPDQGAYDPAGATCYTGHKYVVGWEADTVCHDATTEVCASFMAATSGTQKGINDAGFYVSPIRLTAIRRGHGLLIGDNSSEVGVQFGTTTAANNVPSTAAYFMALNSGGAPIYGVMTQLPDNNFRSSLPTAGSFQVQDQGTSEVLSLRPTALFSSGRLAVVSQSVTLNDAADARPACGITIRGMFWVVRAGAGVADTVAVCTKDSGELYAWRTLI